MTFLPASQSSSTPPGRSAFLRQPGCRPTATLAIIYAVAFIHFYNVGAWIIDNAGAPVYTDFTDMWVVGIEALRGEAARLYDSAEFLKIQAEILGERAYFYPNWPYPPTVSLIAAPFGALPYLYAFLCWDAATLLALVIVTYLIVRRLSAIALVLACPFTAWNLLAGQNGFLTGSLLGAALLCLERQPVLAGVFIGCLTYEPQFGILLPVALIAARQWRATDHDCGDGAQRDSPNHRCRDQSAHEYDVDVNRHCTQTVHD